MYTAQTEPGSTFLLFITFEKLPEAQKMSKHNTVLIPISNSLNEWRGESIRIIWFGVFVFYFLHVQSSIMRIRPVVKTENLY